MRMRMLVSALFVLTTLAPSWAGLAQSSGASLSASNGSGEPGDTGISIPIRISPDNGTEVTGVNFDLNFDSSRLTVQNVTIGGAAASAGKMLSWSTPSAGRVRVVIFGLNQTPINSGAIANISFNVDAGASPGSVGLSFSNSTATDAGGSAVSLSTNPGTFTVIAPPPPPATSTNTPIPSTPTYTPTSQPKTLPSATPSATNTPQPSPTRTPTNLPVSTGLPTNTPAPTNTNVPPATATRGLAPTSTISSSASTLTPTSTAVVFSESTEVSISGSPTNTVASGTSSDQNTQEAPIGFGDDGIEAHNSLDVAVAATSTALAQMDGSFDDDDYLTLASGDGDNREGGSGAAFLDALLLNIPFLSTIFLATGAISAMLIPVVGLYVIRKRSVLVKQMKRSESAIYQERLHDQANPQKR